MKFNKFTIILILGIFILLGGKSFAAPILEIKIIYGHHEEINKKIFCVDFGICEYSITILNDPILTRQILGKISKGNGEGESYPMTGEVIDDNLVLKFQKRLDKKAVSADGTYTFPVYENTEVKGDAAKELGFKKFTIQKGNYSFDGTTLKLPIRNVKPLEKTDHKKSDR